MSIGLSQRMCSLSAAVADDDLPFRPMDPQVLVLYFP